MDLSGFAPFFGHRVDGVLGYSFFNNYVVVLDYAGRRLTLCDAKSYQARGLHAIPVDLSSRQPYIAAQIDGRDGHVVTATLEVDTGKVDPFSLNANFARKTGIFHDEASALAVKGVSLGGNTQAWIIRGKALRFGGFDLQRPTIGVAEEDSKRAGQLGYGVLRRFTITFNYSHQQIYLQPNGELNDEFQFDHAGIILVADGPELSSLKVFMVIAGSPAASAGIKDGDEILAIGEKPSKTLNLDQARNYFEQQVGAETLVVRRGNKKLTLTIHLKPLI